MIWPLASVLVAALFVGPIPPEVPTLVPTQPELATGGVELDMGSRQALRIGGDGHIHLDDARLVANNIGWDSKLIHVAHRLTRDRVTVAIGIVSPNTPHSENIMLAEIDLLHGRLVWHAVLHAPGLWHERGSDWKVVFGDEFALVQRDYLLVAVDMRTGTQAWALAGVDAEFEEHYLGSLEVERRGITIGATRVRGRDVWVDAKDRETGAALVLRLDLATGRRIDEGAADRLSPKPLFAFCDRWQMPMRDESPPPPPPKPADHDGVMIGAATLVWSTKTGRGVIVNPTVRGLGSVFEAARAQTVTVGGVAKPVEWVAVIDTATLATEMSLGKLGKPGAPLGATTLVFDYAGGIEATGDSIDADSVAAALAVPAIRSRVDLRNLPKDVRVRQDRYGAIDVVFGAVAFHDDTHRWDEIRVSRR